MRQIDNGHELFSGWGPLLLAAAVVIEFLVFTSAH